MRNSILRPPKKGLSLKSYLFGKERVTLQSQVYRKMFVNRLLHMIVFGPKLSKMKAHEVVYKTKNTTVLHISSNSRMKKLFTYAGLSAVACKRGENTLSCCGKVNVLIKGHNHIGYIVDESSTRWIVHLGGHHVRYLKRGTYDTHKHRYNFDQKEPRITEYWPVRIKIYTSGETRYTINRVCFNNRNKVLIQHSS